LENIVRGTPASKSKKEEKVKRPRKVPNFQYNIFEDVKNKQASITIEELLKSKVYRDQMKNGLIQTQKDVRFLGDNSAALIQDKEQEVDRS